MNEPHVGVMLIGRRSSEYLTLEQIAERLKVSVTGSSNLQSWHSGAACRQSMCGGSLLRLVAYWPMGRDGAARARVPVLSATLADGRGNPRRPDGLHVPQSSIFARTRSKISRHPGDMSSSSQPHTFPAVASSPCQATRPSASIGRATPG